MQSGGSLCAYLQLKAFPKNFTYKSNVKSICYYINDLVATKTVLYTYIYTAHDCRIRAVLQLEANHLFL